MFSWDPKPHLTKILQETFPDIQDPNCWETPPQESWGDLAFPCFSLAKIYKKSPQILAQEALPFFSDSCWIEKVEARGGFINVFLKVTTWAAPLISEILNENYFRSSKVHSHERIMVEYSQPNTHKEFHVGHVRNVCLGDSLCRLLRYRGFQLFAVNYMGDEGTHVAKAVWQGLKNPFKSETPLKPDSRWYARHYIHANQELEKAGENEKLLMKEEISSILRELENQQDPSYSYWKKSRQDCLEDFEKIYQKLDVKFDHIFYESELSKESQELVDEGIQKGWFHLSHGAWGMDMRSWNLGYLMVRKSDGTTLYITKDLVLARKKFQDFQIQKNIHVVGSEQKFHFQQLFKALELMGFEKEAAGCHHVSYGLVTLPTGKMSSREGGVVTFWDLVNILKKALTPALEKYKDSWSAEQKEETLDKLAMGCLKYGMLSVDPGREIVFEPGAWTSFEGHSGAYLMYAYTRMCSLLKMQESWDVASADYSFFGESEKRLLTVLWQFHDHVLQASESYRPSVLAQSLYQLSRAFHRFYGECPIRTATGGLREARLALVKAASFVLKQGFYLLGMTPPEKM